MIDKWAADVIGKMHQYGITAKQLSEFIGWNPKYFSTVVNGHKKPKRAEKTITEGLEEMIEGKARLMEESA